MRARLTLILTIVAAVLATLFGFAGFGVSTASAAGSSGPDAGGWFAGATDVVHLQVELAARVRPLQRAQLAALAVTLTTPPPPLPPLAKTPETFAFPADGPITSPYGRRWGRAHQGVDIDAPTGSAIVAAQGGTVTLAGWKNGYGKTVIIDHGNGVSTLYAHQSSLGVQVGEQVERGQFLGTVGATGQVTAAHLHYEVHVDGVPRNPGPWL